jgi:hypothetical protein
MDRDSVSAEKSVGVGDDLRNLAGDRNEAIIASLGGPMASLEFFDRCAARKVNKKGEEIPCMAKRQVRVIRKNGSLYGEFCRTCGEKAVSDLADREARGE